MSLPEYRVRDIMSDTPISVTSSTVLVDAALALRANAIRHLPVLEDGLLVGLVTDRDIQRCAPSRLIPITEETYNELFADNTVNRIMTREPVCVSPDASLPAAIAVMQQGRFGCLPVVEDGTLVGMLTRSDIIDAFQRLLSGKPVSRYQEAL